MIWDGAEAGRDSGAKLAQLAAWCKRGVEQKTQHIRLYKSKYSDHFGFVLAVHSQSNDKHQMIKSG